jgi:hypothetical protein
VSRESAGEGRSMAAARTAHLLAVSANLNMATISLWSQSPRAASILGMFEASIRWPAPGGHDEDLLERLRDLFEEAKKFHAREDFPAMMARLRVAYDLVSIRIIEISGG